MAFPWQIWVLFAVAAAISAMGFHKFIWFISLGYGFSIAGLGIALLILYGSGLTVGTALICALMIVYGMRLGGYLAIREIKSASYNTTMKNEVKDGSTMAMGAKIGIWVACILLYVMEVAPVFYRLQNGSGTDAITIIGFIIMVSGVVMESLADKQKSAAKKINPRRFCDQGLFKLVRCPNYFGEVLFWTGMFLSGVTSLCSAGQWIMAILGYLGIVYIMFSGARRLELRQNKNYGSDPEYQPKLPLKRCAEFSHRLSFARTNNQC